MTTSVRDRFAEFSPHERANFERALHRKIEADVEELGMQISGFPDKGGVTRLYNDYLRQVLSSLSALKYVAEGGDPMKFDEDAAIRDLATTVAKITDEALAGIRYDVEHEIAVGYGLTEAEVNSAP